MPGFKVVAINDLTDTKTLAHLLRHDTAYGPFDKKVESDEKNLIVSGKKIQVFAEKDPSVLPWGALGVDIVLECTGRFTTAETAKAHLKAGAKRVIISAPAKGEGVVTHVLGVNGSGAVSALSVLVLEESSGAPVSEESKNFGVSHAARRHRVRKRIMSDVLG
jgi:glyceraldehyde 3-phosphate dehydrogenase